jgi:hypothetical protein
MMKTWVIFLLLISIAFASSREGKLTINEAVFDVKNISFQRVSANKPFIILQFEQAIMDKTSTQVLKMFEELKGLKKPQSRIGLVVIKNSELEALEKILTAKEIMDLLSSFKIEDFIYGFDCLARKDIQTTVGDSVKVDSLFYLLTESQVDFIRVRKAIARNFQEAGGSEEDFKAEVSPVLTPMAVTDQNLIHHAEAMPDKDSCLLDVAIVLERNEDEQKQ